MMMPPNLACDECGRPRATQHCGGCGLLLCDAHRECPDCESEKLNEFREDQQYDKPNGGG
jgi:hypothetical protein